MMSVVTGLMGFRQYGSISLRSWGIGVLVSLAAGSALAQSTAPPSRRYWVTLRDKSGVQFSPAQYFSRPAQARRRRQHLPACDASDLPVRPDYVAAIAARVDTITLVSRWFNAVACRATPAQAAALRELAGVQSVALWPMSEVKNALACRRSALEMTNAPFAQPLSHSAAQPPKPLSSNDYLLARRQTTYLDEPALRRAHLDGKGLRIAILDVGFEGLPGHPAFRDLLDGHHIVATHDFLKNRPDVFHGGSHGIEVLACLAGRLPGDGAPGPALGLAPAADFLLARTEQLHRERYAEEEAWLAAAEWADREGADIINSSLAYTEQRYFPENMNGRRSLIARAANLAARKGILVVSAAGNDGDDDWVRIGTPADADSVLAIGGLDPETGLHAVFSSYGPSADRRPKPNLAAFGTVLTATPEGYERLEGTSFSSPLVAGFAACVWQQNRNLTVMQLFHQLQESAELYPYYDYAHGYGLPQISYFANKAALLPAPAPTFDFVPHDSLIAVVIQASAARRPARSLPLMAEQPDELVLAALTPVPKKEEVESAKKSEQPARVGREQPLPTDEPLPLTPDPDFPPYLYWSLADRRGVLRRYEARAVTQRLVVQIPRRLVRNGDVLRVHFKGYTATYSE